MSGKEWMLSGKELVCPDGQLRPIYCQLRTISWNHICQDIRQVTLPQHFASFSTASSIRSWQPVRGMLSASSATEVQETKVQSPHQQWRSSWWMWILRTARSQSKHFWIFVGMLTFQICMTWTALHDCLRGDANDMDFNLRAQTQWRWWHGDSNGRSPWGAVRISPWNSWRCWRHRFHTPYALCQASYAQADQDFKALLHVGILQPTNQVCKCSFHSCCLTQ